MAEEFRRKVGIDPDALVVGYTGRLAPEKNLSFLAGAVSSFALKNPRTHFLVVGYGPSQEEVEQVFQNAGLAERLHFTGPLSGGRSCEFLSCNGYISPLPRKPRTQAMVLAEAMAAGVVVVAVDAPGVA